MAFNEDKQPKKGASAPAGASPKKERTEFTLRISAALHQRLTAVAEMKGMTIKHFAEQVLSDFVNEEIRKVLDKSSKYKA
jgi:predicted HicB family RNase H-like nuclease